MLQEYACLVNPEPCAPSLTILLTTDPITLTPACLSEILRQLLETTREPL